MGDACERRGEVGVSRWAGGEDEGGEFCIHSRGKGPSGRMDQAGSQDCLACGSFLMNGMRPSDEPLQ